jgi:hypothetical protein
MYEKSSEIGFITPKKSNKKAIISNYKQKHLSVHLIQFGRTFAPIRFWAEM